jgi:hypothetical protein
MCHEVTQRELGYIPPNIYIVMVSIRVILVSLPLMAKGPSPAISISRFAGSRHSIKSKLIPAPFCIKNINDGMSQSDRAGLHFLLLATESLLFARSTAPITT